MKAIIRKKDKPQNNPNAVIYCDECKFEFPRSSVNINEATVNVCGQVLTLVHFTCPECNKIYRITLKDARCEELQEDIEKTKTRIRNVHGSNNNELARTLDVMVKRKHERLASHMTKLNERFPGTFTFVASENNHEEKIIKYLP